MKRIRVTETAKAYMRELQAQGLKQREISERTGFDRHTIAKSIGLTRKPRSIAGITNTVQYLITVADNKPHVILQKAVNIPAMKHLKTFEVEVLTKPKIMDSVKLGTIATFQGKFPAGHIQECMTWCYNVRTCESLSIGDKIMTIGQRKAFKGYMKSFDQWVIYLPIKIIGKQSSF